MNRRHLLFTAGALGLTVGERAYSQPVYVGPAPWSPAPDNVSNYKGADSGQLVASTATTAFSLLSAGSVAVQVIFRRLDGPGEGRILAGLQDPTFKDSAPIPLATGVELTASGLTYSKRKYVGTVTSNALPPGRYEVTAIRLNTPQAVQDIGPFAIPFEIAPSRATYIGEFRALELWKKGFGIFGYNVVLSDQSARDIPLIKARRPEIDQVAVNVPDVSGLGVRFLSARP
jgi:hypothetical protein